jgi:hypothetical protein
MAGVDFRYQRLVIEVDAAQLSAWSRKFLFEV